MKQMTLRLSDDLHGALVAQAAQDRRSLTQTILMALEALVEPRQPKTVPPPSGGTKHPPGWICDARHIPGSTFCKNEPCAWGKK